ncbi:hypothetical protein [Streptomyces sp. NPDC018000]|uniref:hypothetical protein n=1 Tax=Streptomyces sp. NPDC018000 TaxID=3365028 RepID=UPI0037B0BBAB
MAEHAMLQLEARPQRGRRAKALRSRTKVRRTRAAVVGATVGLLIDILARHGLQVARSQTEAENLARLVADVIADGPRTQTELVDAVRRTFDLDAIALLRPTETGWQTEQAAGSLPVTRNSCAPSLPNCA